MNKTTLDSENVFKKLISQKVCLIKGFVVLIFF